MCAHDNNVAHMHAGRHLRTHLQLLDARLQLADTSHVLLERALLLGDERVALLDRTLQLRDEALHFGHVKHAPANVDLERNCD